MNKALQGKDLAENLYYLPKPLFTSLKSVVFTKKEISV